MTQKPFLDPASQKKSVRKKSISKKEYRQKRIQEFFDDPHNFYPEPGEEKLYEILMIELAMNS